MATRNADTRTAVELEEALRNGDLSIGADTIAAAKAAEHHARLRAQGEAAQQTRAAAAARDADLAALRVRLLARDDDLDPLRDARRRAADALAELVHVAQERRASIAALRDEVRAFGVAEAGQDLVPADPSGLGWVGRYGIDPPAVVVDATVISGGNVRDMLDELVRTIVERFALGKPSAAADREFDEQLDALAFTTTRPTARVRLLQDWGGHRAGRVIDVDGPTAEWLTGRVRLAVWAESIGLGVGPTEYDGGPTAA